MDTLKALNDRIEELQQQLRWMQVGILKKDIKSNNVYDHLYWSKTYNDLDPEVQEIKDKILDLKLKKENILLNTPNKAEDYNEWNNIKIDINNKIISIWKRTFTNFTGFYELLRIKENKSTAKSQTKAWVVLIYSVFRYAQENQEKDNITKSDLYKYFEEFHKKWKERWFKGMTIDNNAEIRANQILKESWLLIRFDLSKDNLLITN